MFPSFAKGTRRRSSVSTCRKLAALRADSFRPRRRGGRRVWRRSAAAAMRLPRGDTLLTHHGNWSSKAAEADHINERAADMESCACAVAELVVSHRAASWITAASLQQSSAPPVSTPRSCQKFWREDIEPQPRSHTCSLLREDLVPYIRSSSVVPFLFNFFVLICLCVRVRTTAHLPSRRVPKPFTVPFLKNRLSRK